MRFLLALIRHYPRRHPIGHFPERLLASVVDRYGLMLIRSRRGLRGSEPGPSYALVDRARCTLLLADPETGYGITLDEIERYLDELSMVRERLHKAGPR
jgi:hypothetical protein